MGVKMAVSDALPVYVYTVYARREFPQKFDTQVSLSDVSEKPPVAGDKPVDWKRVGKGAGAAGFAAGAIAAAARRETDIDFIILATTADMMAKHTYYQNTGFINTQGSPASNSRFKAHIAADDVVSYRSADGSQKGVLSTSSEKATIFANFGDKRVSGSEFCAYQRFEVASTIPPDRAEADGLRGGVVFYDRAAAMDFAAHSPTYVEEHMSHLPLLRYHQGYTDDGLLRFNEGDPIVKEFADEQKKLEVENKYLFNLVEKHATRSLFGKIHAKINSDYAKPDRFHKAYREKQALGDTFDFEAAFHDKSITEDEKSNLEDAFAAVSAGIEAGDDCMKRLEQQAEKWMKDQPDLSRDELRAAKRFKENRIPAVQGVLNFLRGGISRAAAGDKSEVKEKIAELQTELAKLQKDVVNLTVRIKSSDTPTRSFSDEYKDKLASHAEDADAAVSDVKMDKPSQ